MIYTVDVDFILNTGTPTEGGGEVDAPEDILLNTTSLVVDMTWGVAIETTKLTGKAIEQTGRITGRIAGVLGLVGIGNDIFSENVHTSTWIDATLMAAGVGVAVVGSGGTVLLGAGIVWGVSSLFGADNAVNSLFDEYMPYVSNKGK